MFPKCFNCSSNLSLSWFLGAFIWTEHRCVKCNQLHAFTYWRGFYAALTGAGVVLIPLLLEGVIASYGVRLLFSSTVLFALLSIIPGQHKLSSNKDIGVK